MALTKIQRGYGLGVLAIVLLFVLVPDVTFAQGLVPCDGGPTDQCDFSDLMILVQNLITFVLVYVAGPLLAIAIVTAGFMFMTQGANPEKRKQARKILINAVAGFIIALAAWLIVASILRALGVDDAYILLDGV